ncbi:MAG: ATP-binding protein, partial [Paludibacteraceae bacterium]|nr:ATP-binding protein [Paludibacteraceae bacterium]
DALRISGVFSNNYSWRNEKAQIDLIINREDNTVNICEMKFNENQYTIDGDYANRLKNKIDTFKTYSKLKNKSVQLTMVTTYGIVRNSHSNIIQNEVTLNDFFTELRYQ